VATATESDGDIADAMAERVRTAFADKTPLVVRGADSKRALGHDPVGETLSTIEHRGIVNHEPTELVLTARAGTPIATLNAALAASRQMMPFEPPDGGGTLGGVIACGLSGPRRPYAGAARDYVLGTRVISGRGEILGFGGEVMKNVAGYDVSRVQTGAFGTLGVLLDVSMKVLPMHELEITLHHALDTAGLAGSGEGVGAGGAADGAGLGPAGSLVALARRPWPLTASAIVGTDRYIRLGGSAVAVEAAARELGGERMNDDAAPWEAIRERTHPFFDGERPLWRIAVPDHAAAIDLDGDWLLDWGGAQRWLRSEAAPAAVFAAAAKAGGHATRYRRVIGAGEIEGVDGPLFQPLVGPLQRLSSRLRDSFDPHRVLNRGRYHPELD